MDRRGRCEPIAITTILSRPIPTFGEPMCCCGRVGKTSLPPGFDPRKSKVLCSLGSTCRRRRRKRVVVVVREAISGTREKESLTDCKIPRQCPLVLLVKVRWKEVLDSGCSDGKWTVEREAGGGDAEFEILFSDGYMTIKRVHVSEYQLCSRTDENHGRR
jgi:hypothetical protein